MDVFAGNLSYADSNLKIHNHTEGFIDIEVSIQNVKIECSIGNILGFDIADGKTEYSFFYRRPLSREQCRNDKNFFRQMLTTEKTVHIVGISPYKENKPNKITRISAFFARLQVGKTCKAYFEHHCDLPKNYWAGMLPSEELNKRKSGK